MFNSQCAIKMNYCVLRIGYCALVQGCQGIIGHGPSAFLDKLLEKNWGKDKNFPSVRSPLDNETPFAYTCTINPAT